MSKRNDLRRVKNLKNRSAQKEREEESKNPWSRPCFAFHVENLLIHCKIVDGFIANPMSENRGFMAFQIVSLSTSRGISFRTDNSDFVDDWDILLWD